MTLTLTFLGTGAAIPSLDRNVASLALAREGETLLFDCGEGTQRQMMRYGVSFSVRDIFFTHFHADHLLGLTGLVRTLGLQDRTDPLRLYGPRGARRVLEHAACRRDRTEQVPGPDRGACAGRPGEPAGVRRRGGRGRSSCAHARLRPRGTHPARPLPAGAGARTRRAGGAAVGPPAPRRDGGLAGRAPGGAHRSRRPAATGTEGGHLGRHPPQPGHRRRRAPAPICWCTRPPFRRRSRRRPT